MKLLSVAAAVACAAMITATPPPARGADDESTTSSAVVAALTEALMSPVGEYESLSFYQAVLDKHGDVLPFRNIVRAEQRHADALISHLQRLGAPVPSNPYEGKTTAPATLPEAAQMSLDGEIGNVEMYDRLIKKAAADPAVVQTLEHLQFASREHHLVAFKRFVASGGNMGQGAGAGKGHGGRGKGMGHGARAGGGKGMGQGQGMGHGMGRGRGAQAGQTSATAVASCDDASSQTECAP